MSFKYDIILPTYGRQELIDVCVASVVFRSGDGPWRLIWIANGENDRVPCYSTEVHPNENIGYTKAINAGIALSTAPYVVLLNSDTEVVTAGWLDKLAATFAGNDRLAAVGPASEAPENGICGRMGHNQGFVLTPGWPTPGKGWGFDPRLSFWCVMIRREALLDVGYLDDNFSPGCGEDDDWLYRATMRGWQYGVETDVLVRHVEPHASWDPQTRSAVQARNLAYLQRKYGLRAETPVAQ